MQKREYLVANEIQRRWGIVALAVAMFFVTMINAGINGNKTSFYYWVWAMVGWYGYKGNLEQIRVLMKYLIWLNLGVLLLVFLFFEEQTVGYATRGGDKQSMAFGVLIMLVPKIFVYMYCDKEVKESNAKKDVEQINKVESNKTTKKEENIYIKSMSEEGRKKFQNQSYVAPKRIESMEDAYQRLSTKIESKIELNVATSALKVTNPINEDLCWEEALNEFDSEKRNKGMWARLYVENNGEEEKIKISYIKIRAEQLISEAKQKQVDSVREEKMEIERYSEKTIEEMLAEKMYYENAINGITYVVFKNGMAGIKQNDGYIVYQAEDNVKTVLKQLQNSNLYSLNGFVKRIRSEQEKNEKEINGYVEMLEKNSYRYVGYSIDSESKDKWVFVRDGMRYDKSKSDLTETAFSLT